MLFLSGTIFARKLNYILMSNCILIVKKTILVFSFDCNVDIIARKIAAKYFNEFLTD